MSRRDVVPRPEREVLAPPPSKCAKVLYYTWRLCSVVFSHFVMISLVVAYCILGAVTFEKLEAAHEKEVKMNISRLRRNTTDSIWGMTKNATYFNESNWTADVVDMLKDFENALLLEMKVRGWDGSESTTHIQWTFTGALFYSIIVITTIGYGHIAPKTQTGKVVTIFYAILGIPLMLLCLSNIGDVMASSFRFLYWRVCCYVCTRPPKRRRRHHPSIRRSIRGSRHGSTRRKRPERAHSDTECRYRDSGYSSGRGRRGRLAHGPSLRTASQPPLTRTYEPRGYERDVSPVRYDRYGRDHYEEDEEFPRISLPLKDLEAALQDLNDHQMKASKADIRSKSLPRPSKSKPDFGPRDFDRDFDPGPKDRRDFDPGPKNRRDFDPGPRNTRDFDPGPSKDRFEMHDLYDVDYENYKERKAQQERERRNDYRERDYDPEDDDYEFDSPKRRRTWDRRGDRWDFDRDREDYQERRPNRRARSALYDGERRWDEWDDRRRWDDEGDRRRREGERRRWDDRDGDRRRWDDKDGDRRWEDVEGGRRRLRRLYTTDESRPPRDMTPSPERDYWSDDGVVVPARRGRSAAWGSRHTDIYEDDAEPVKQEIKPVPIWLCVCLVASYIVAGTFLFQQWEDWNYLDSAYFCFITLTTIGFGDFVPGMKLQGRTDSTVAAVHSIALCSLYLLFGIALLAMSFNLVQEQVRANVAALATRLGIIKPRDPDY
ncbi:uncharacterized protein LOC125229330 isoform X2 [Leguminivora glycinivorella]|uniref:uncharacterized protein LOC125229330 isoform X2 n=1 Tax=Leguminivora glycinivorella TaxID=1035111 RepID=UPI00200E1763|nr:uncharacterized protein LOC125229330 isoform X2 [Leguminivora glycinivorella]